VYGGQSGRRPETVIVDEHLIDPEAIIIIIILALSSSSGNGDDGPSKHRLIRFIDDDTANDRGAAVARTKV